MSSTSLGARLRAAAAVLAGQAAGLIVAGVLWVLLFAQSFDIAPPRYPTLEAAEAVAIEAGGRHRWPATTTRVEVVDAERVDVVRTWLGVQESVVRVEHTRPDGMWHPRGPVLGGPCRAFSPAWCQVSELGCSSAVPSGRRPSDGRDRERAGDRSSSESGR